MNYLGCWIDFPSNRVLKDLYKNHRGAIDWYNLGETILKCGKDAVDSGKDYNLFAVQHYGECWSQEGNPEYKKMRAAPKGCKYGAYKLSGLEIVSLSCFIAGRVSFKIFILIRHTVDAPYPTILEPTSSFIRFVFKSPFYFTTLSY